MSRPRKIHRLKVEYREVINRTDREIRFYDGNGDIAICRPHCHEDLLKNQLSETTMVIVECDGEIYASAPDDKAVYATLPGYGRGSNLVHSLFRSVDGAIVKFYPRSPFMEDADTYYA